MADPNSPKETHSSPPASPPQEPSTTSPPSSKPKDPSSDRATRFAALRRRAQESTTSNLRAAAAESSRLSTDPSTLHSLSRKHAIASHNLLKADTEASGEDFERKRAWDWTVEDSEKWDKRMAKKARNKENVYFQDFHREGNKVYKRQVKGLPKVDLEEYKRKKAEAVRRAVESGELEVVEMGDGIEDGMGGEGEEQGERERELVVVDKDGKVFSSAEGVGFVEKPGKEAVDRLVDDLRRAEDARMRKRRERRGKGEDGDVTYVNEKNKQFNQKLGRFYDKYTTEVRESFERGTAI